MRALTLVVLLLVVGCDDDTMTVDTMHAASEVEALVRAGAGN